MHRRWSNPVPSVVLACLTAVNVGRAQGSVSDRAVVAGHIVARGTKAGLPGVEVRIVGDTARVSTDSTGSFVLATHGRGTSIVMLRKLGYSPATVPLDLNPGDSLHIETGLARSVTNLDTLKVVGRTEAVAPARLAGFEMRRQHNRGGVFITPEELETTGSTSIVDLIRKVPGIKILDASFGRLVVASARGSRLDASGQPAPCRIRVMVDGMLMPINERPKLRNQVADPMFGGPDLELPLPVISPKLVHGIEIYPGPASMPRDMIPHGEDAFCGLIAIWSK
jgi:hypothetical protein